LVVPFLLSGLGESRTPFFAAVFAADSPPVGRAVFSGRLFALRNQ
jgi:hypothetical protein